MLTTPGEGLLLGGRRSQHPRMLGGRTDDDPSPYPWLGALSGAPYLVALAILRPRA